MDGSGRGRPPGDDAEVILERVDRLRVWRQGDRRAPHKPLLLLLALARLRRGEPRLVRFEDVEPTLRDLLLDFGPPVEGAPEPYLPFWHLQRDGLWEIIDADALRGSRRRPLPSDLRECGEGGFPTSVDATLRGNLWLVDRVVALLLERTFPASLHDEVLSAVGLPAPFAHESPQSLTDFRRAVLREYGQRCAVCGAYLRIDRAALGLDAAHIMWRAAGGPNEPSNGLALCVLHHRALDRGALGINDDHLILISDDVHGDPASVELWLRRFAGQSLGAPLNPEARPQAAYLAWHRREVFRG